MFEQTVKNIKTSDWRRKIAKTINLKTEDDRYYSRNGIYYQLYVTDTQLQEWSMLKSAAQQASRSKGQGMSQGFTTPDGRRQQLCGAPTEAGKAPDGQTISTNLWDHIGPEWRETEMSGKCWETSSTQLIIYVN